MADFSATLRSPGNAALLVSTAADAATAAPRGRISPLYYKMIATASLGGSTVIWTAQGGEDASGAYAPVAIVAGSARVAAISTISSA